MFSFRLISRSYHRITDVNRFEVIWEEDRIYLSAFERKAFVARGVANDHLEDWLWRILNGMGLTDDLTLGLYMFQAVNELGVLDFETHLFPRGGSPDHEHYIQFNPPGQVWVDKNLSLVFAKHNRFHKKKVDLVSLIPF